MSTSQMFNTEVCYGSELAYDAELATPFQALLIIPATLEEISTGYLYFAIPLSHTAKQEALATNTESHPCRKGLSLCGMGGDGVYSNCGVGNSDCGACSHYCRLGNHYFVPRTQLYCGLGRDGLGHGQDEMGLGRDEMGLR